MSLLTYLGGGALLAALLRWWRPGLEWRWCGAYWLFAGAFFAAPLLTPLLQVPTDIAYRFRPWSATVGPGFQPANPLLSDVPLQVLPFRTLVRERLLHGQAPLWAGEMGTGQPLLGNAQSAPFSPLGLLTLPLAPVRALAIAAALKLFLSLLLTDALLAALGASRAAAAFGAIAYSFSVFAICWAYHPHGMAMAWVPGVLLALVLLRRGERGALAGLVVCSAGLALSGHPETLAHTALAAAGVTAALLLSPAGLSRPRFLLRLAAGAALAAGLSAPALLPVVEALGQSSRGHVAGAAPGLMQPPPFELAYLRPLAAPLAFGSPRDGTWSGPQNFNELCSAYAGLLALALALAAALVLRGRALAVLAAGALALAAALGVGPALRLFTAVPPFDQAMNGRLRLFWVLAVAVAASLGLDALRHPRARRAAAAAIATVALALAVNRPPGTGLPRTWWLVTLAGGLLATLALLWIDLRRSRGGGENAAKAAGAVPGLPSALPWLLVTFLALDLGLLNAGFLPVLPPDFDLSPVPPIQLLMHERETAPHSPWRLMAYDPALLPNLSALYGLWDARANDPMHPARAAMVVSYGMRPRHWTVQEAAGAPPRYPREFLSYLAVRYLFTPPGERLPAPWQESWNGASGTLWRNPGALPLFFMPAACRHATSDDDALRATVDNADFAAGAVFEDMDPKAQASRPLLCGEAEPRAARPAAESRPGGGPKATAVQPPDIRPTPQSGAVHLDRAAANAFDLTVSTPSGGLVASSVTFDRGWRLTVDGIPAVAVRANAAFLGLGLRPGTHRVRLDYRPAGWVWGLRLCALALAACLLALPLHELAGQLRHPRDIGRAARQRRRVSVR